MLLCLSCTERESQNHLYLPSDGRWSRKDASTSYCRTYLIQVAAQLTGPVAGSSVLEEGLSLARDALDEVRESLHLRLLEVILVLEDGVFIFESLDLLSLLFQNGQMGVVRSHGKLGQVPSRRKGIVSCVDQA